MSLPWLRNRLIYILKTCFRFYYSKSLKLLLFFFHLVAQQIIYSNVPYCFILKWFEDGKYFVDVFMYTIFFRGIEKHIPQKIIFKILVLINWSISNHIKLKTTIAVRTCLTFVNFLKLASSKQIHISSFTFYAIILAAFHKLVQLSVRKGIRDCCAKLASFPENNLIYCAKNSTCQ